MKKVLFLLLASFLVLSACGQEESKSEDKKETKSASKDKKKEDKKSDDDKKDNKKSDEEKSKTDDKSSEQVANSENVSTEEQPNTQEQSQEQQSNSDYGLHYDPEYDKPGYTGMVDESGMPELDPNENYDPHGGVVPGEDYMDTDEQPREDAASGPRSLREIKEDTGKGASDFTQAEIDEANAYAREH